MKKPTLNFTLSYIYISGLKLRYQREAKYIRKEILTGAMRAQLGRRRARQTDMH